MADGIIKRDGGNVWKRLTRLFRSGPVVRHKVQAGNERFQTPQGTARAYKKELSSLYVNSLASYGQYERFARYSDYQEMEYCLSGDTKIAIPSGFKTIRELAEEGALAREQGRDDTFVVYSWDHGRNRLVATLGKNARLTRRDVAFRVKFDNGKEIVGTADHRLMLRDGSYMKISDLRVGHPMMPFRREHRFGSPYLSVYDGVRWVYEHRMIGEFITQRPLNDDEIVHHENEIKSDNRVENLSVMTRCEHSSHHLREYNKLKWDPSNEKWILKFRNNHSIFMTENNPSARLDITFTRILETAEKNDFHLFRTMEVLDIDYPTIRRRLQERSFKNWEKFAVAYRPGWRNHGHDNNGEKNPRWDDRLTYQMVCEAWEPGIRAKELAKKLGTTVGKVHGRVTKMGFSSPAHFCRDYTNCRVVSVEEVGEMDLYDLTVDGYKNFATDSVISHNTPELASAINVYADGVTSYDETGRVLSVSSKNAEIKAVLERLFYDIINIEFNIWSWVRNLAKYGDCFLFVDAKEESGVLNLYPMPVNEVERQEGFDKDNPTAVRYRWMTQGGSILQNWQVIHFRLQGNDNFLPYGQSVIEAARRVWRQLILIEDAMLVYRIVRSPERRVFYIDVGNIAPDQMDAMMEQVKNRLRRTQIVDPASGRVDLRYNPLSVDEDYFIPTRGDKSSRVESLPGGQFTGDIEDVQYIQNKLFAALQIPKAYLGYEGDVGSKATLAQQDVRFARTIERLQRCVVSELNKIAIIHLFLLGYSGEDLADFQLRLASASSIAEQQSLELWRSRFEVAATAQEGTLDRRTVYRKIFNMSDEQIEEIAEGKRADKLEDLVLESMQLPDQSADAAPDGGEKAGEAELPKTLGGEPESSAEPAPEAEPKPETQPEGRERGDEEVVETPAGVDGRTIRRPNKGASGVNSLTQPGKGRNLFSTSPDMHGNVFSTKKQTGSDPYDRRSMRRLVTRPLSENIHEGMDLQQDEVEQTLTEVRSLARKLGED